MLSWQNRDFIPPIYSSQICPPPPLNDAQNPSSDSENHLQDDLLPSYLIAYQDAHHQDDEHSILQDHEILHQEHSTQNASEHEPIPARPPPKISKFKKVSKNLLRNNYGLTIKQSHSSLDKPKNFRVLKKLCAKYSKRLGNISARDVVNLDISKRNLTIQNQEVASFFYVEGADYSENCKRYLFGKYFMWYGRNRYALDAQSNKKIKPHNIALYYQTMSMFVQQVPVLLQMFENTYNIALGN